MADIKINGLDLALSISDNMQLETDIGGTVANKINIVQLKDTIAASSQMVEKIQDTIGTSITGSGLNVTYDDTSGITSIVATPTTIGLGSVDNTSDANKPISNATQAALDDKADLSGADFSGDISASNLSGTNTGDQVNIPGNAETVTTIAGKISAGSNLILTGSGTDADPYVIDGALALVANNCRFTQTINNSANWVQNCWTKHRSGPAGFPKGIFAAFVNGQTSTNSEQSAQYNFNLRCAVYVNGKFTRGAWLTNPASVDSLISRHWGKDTAFLDAVIPPNTDFYITNRRVAEDLGVAGSYNVITNTQGQTFRNDGLISGTDVTKDFTMGVGIAYGMKALSPNINSSGVFTSIPVDPNNRGFNVTAGGAYVTYYGPTGVNQPGALIPGTTAPGGYTNPSGGGVGSVSVVGGGTGMNNNEPPTIILGGVGTAGSGFGTATASYGPSAIFGEPDGDSTSVLCIGDSITNGVGSVDGVGDLYGNFGCYEQAFQNKCGIMISAQNGDSYLGTYGNYTNRIAFWQYLYNLGLRIDSVVFGYGANDFNSNANSDVLTVTQTQAAAWGVRMKGIWPDAEIIYTTIMPETTTTDGGITTANQTPVTIGSGTPNFAAGGRVSQWNAGILNGTGVAGQDGYLDIAGVVADATTPSKWRVAGEFTLAAYSGVAFSTPETAGQPLTMIHPNRTVGIPYIAANLDTSQVLKPPYLRDIARPQFSYISQKGEAGEDKERFAPAATSLTTATPANVNSIVLTAGVWYLYATFTYVLTGATITSYKASTSKLSATQGRDEQSVQGLPNLTTTTGTITATTGRIKVVVPERSTVTYNAVAEAAFSAGTVTATAAMRAEAK
jgi:hypothetical protein